MSTEYELQIRGRRAARNYITAFAHFITTGDQDAVVTGINDLGMYVFRAGLHGTPIPECEDTGTPALDFLILASRILQQPDPLPANVHGIATPRSATNTHEGRHDLMPLLGRTGAAGSLPVRLARSVEEGRISHRRARALMDEHLTPQLQL